MIIYENPNTTCHPDVAYFLVETPETLDFLDVKQYKERIVSNCLAALSLQRVTLAEAQTLMTDFINYEDRVHTGSLKAFRATAFYDSDHTDQDLVSLRKDTLMRAAEQGHLPTRQLMKEFRIFEHRLGMHELGGEDIWVAKNGILAALPHRGDAELVPVESEPILPDSAYYDTAQRLDATHQSYKYLFEEKDTYMTFKGMQNVLGVLEGSRFVPVFTIPDLIE